MSGNVYGKLFRVTTWGESHGPALGAVVDGCPAGIALSEEDIQKQLDRRKPGASPYATARSEADAVRLLSGVFEGVTTGTAVSMIINNENQRSKDYDELARVFRPGHADYGYQMKYGRRDYRGGGRSSGRETAARVAAGALAGKILERLGIAVYAYVKSIAGISVRDESFDPAERDNNPLCMPDRAAYEAAAAVVERAVSEGDSLGAVVECVVTGLRPGIGEPVFDKLDAALARAIFSIGAVKAVELGAGMRASGMRGSENNDGFYYENGSVVKYTNRSGGVLGGISDGGRLVMRAAFKPTPSISKTQKTVNEANENILLNIKGRHDPLVAPRAVVVAEAMTAVTLVDFIMRGVTSKMDNLESLYRMM